MTVRWGAGAPQDLITHLILEKMLPAVSPNAMLGQGMSHDSEHNFLQELVLFVF